MVNPYHTQKIDSKWIIDTNVKLKRTVKLLKETIREYFCKSGVGKVLLDNTQKAQVIKEENNKLDFN